MEWRLRLKVMSWEPPVNPFSVSDYDKIIANPVRSQQI